MCRSCPSARASQYQTWVESARTRAWIAGMKTGGPEGRLFRRAWPKLAYWQMCRRPSSPLNQVPGVQTKPLRWA
jgi:hypothetical protein